MEFLKKHYEKLVLSVVLLVVAGVAFWLTQTVSQVKTSLEEQLQTKVRGAKKPFQPVDLTNAVVAIQQFSKPAQLDLAQPHDLFNSERWIRGADGLPKPDPRRELSTALKLMGTKPLSLVLTYVDVVGIGDPIRYQFSIEQQHAKKPSDRRQVTLSLTEGTKNNYFRLVEVRGSKDKSTEVVVELVSGGDRVVLTKGKPFQKTMGYTADLRYEARDFLNKRADETLSVAGTTYKIVAISRDELVVSAPNGTRTSVKLSTN